MRLLDQIAQARSPLVIEDGAGRHRFASAADHAPAVAACPIRYVLDANATDRCVALIESDIGMLSAGNGFLRAPAPRFWLEWPCAPSPGAGSKAGVLVEADDSGRAGRVTTFWEQAEGEPVPGQAVVEFDLDSGCVARAEAGEGLALLPGLHPLAPNLLFVFDGAWLGHFERGGAEAAERAVQAVAFGLLAGVELLFVFSALLCERALFEQRDVSLAPLNRRRAERGKPALLDHIEVRLDLDALKQDGRGRDAGLRQAARLHHVRGHMVGRGGASFWRRSHLRGDASRLLGARTVHVGATAGAGLRGG